MRWCPTRFMPPAHGCPLCRSCLDMPRIRTPSADRLAAGKSMERAFTRALADERNPRRAPVLELRLGESEAARRSVLRPARPRTPAGSLPRNWQATSRPSSVGQSVCYCEIAVAWETSVDRDPQWFHLCFPTSRGGRTPWASTEALKTPCTKPNKKAAMR